MTKTEAMTFYRKELRNNRLLRADHCQLCGYIPFEGEYGQPILGHHWNGYENPLDVWWICKSCNKFLERRHDGSMTLVEAKLYIRSRRESASEPQRYYDSLPIVIDENDPRTPAEREQEATHVHQ